MYSVPGHHNTLSAHMEVHSSLYQSHWFVGVLANDGSHSLGIAVAVRRDQGTRSKADNEVGKEEKVLLLVVGHVTLSGRSPIKL